MSFHLLKKKPLQTHEPISLIQAISNSRKASSTPSGNIFAFNALRDSAGHSKSPDKRTLCFFSCHYSEPFKRVLLCPQQAETSSFFNQIPPQVPRFPLKCLCLMSSQPYPTTGTKYNYIQMHHILSFLFLLQYKFKL